MPKLEGEEELIELYKCQAELYKTMYLNQLKYGNKVTIQSEGVKDVIANMKKDYIPVKKIEDVIDKIKKEENHCRYEFEKLWGRADLSNSEKVKMSDYVLLEQEIGTIRGWIEQLIKENCEEEE